MKQYVITEGQIKTIGSENMIDEATWRILNSLPELPSPDTGPVFECENCGRKHTPQEVVATLACCVKCKDTVIAYAVDAAEYIIAHCGPPPVESLSTEAEVCEWALQSYGDYETTCGWTAGEPDRYTFCPYCGKPITIKPGD